MRFAVFPLPTEVSINPIGRSEQRESQDPVDAAHIGHRPRRDREAPVQTHYRAPAGGEGDPDFLLRNPFLLLQREPASQMLGAGSAIKAMAMYLHPIRLPVEHQLHLAVVLSDPRVLFDLASIQGIKL